MWLPFRANRKYVFFLQFMNYYVEPLRNVSVGRFGAQKCDRAAFYNVNRKVW